MTIKRRALKATSFKSVATGRKLGAVHPGAVLQADFIDAMGITRYRIAKAIGVQPLAV
jgi:antitoxin HigA-1